MTGSKGTILIVDDESESLGLLLGILTEEGYQVRPADSGTLALASVETAPPELILLDMRMPGMDGLEVCRRLKEREGSREIPLMFISASTDPEDRVEGLALGAVDFVTKPFHRPELLARVRTHLELGRLRSQLEVQVASRTEELLCTVQQLQREVAERRRTENALRESEERFRNMADTAPVMIVASGPDGLASFFNKVWLEFTGRTMEQELGLGWSEGVHPDDLEGSLNGLSSSYAARSECRLQFRLRRVDGEYRFLLCRGVPRFEPDGTFAGYIGSLTDVTEIQRSQEEALARQKLESLGVLAGGIAHDFNNLLGSIMANCDLLSAEIDLDSPALESAKRIEAVAVRGAEIVRQLMVYAGQDSTVFEQVDFAHLVREMLQLMKLSSKNAVLKVDLDDALPVIRANPAQLRQVVMNLLSNASDALGDKGGVISITLGRVQPDQESSPDNAVLPRGDYLQLAVSDTGHGMTREIQTKIFDPFFTTKGPGRGLGLAAIQGIIRSHGGDVRVVSEPGQGSRFEILLPCLAETEQDPSEPLIPASPEYGSFTATVLLIEDVDTLRQAVATMLRRNGFSVLDAGDGSAGVDLFRVYAADIDVVLLDVTLPGMPSREVLTQLRELQPDVKVVVGTAHSRDHALAALGGSQSLSYIRKPYNLRELTDLLRKMAMSTRSTS
jgi:two-component system cell cycle sensor histidine kinase/response regulator CckA